MQSVSDVGNKEFIGTYIITNGCYIDIPSLPRHAAEGNLQLMASRKSRTASPSEQWLAAIGKVVAQTRSDRKMTESGLARLAEVSRTQLHRIETGKNSSLLLIAKVLNALRLPATIAGVSLSDPTATASSEVEVNTSIAEALRYLQRAQRLLTDREQ